MACHWYRPVVLWIVLWLREAAVDRQGTTEHIQPTADNLLERETGRTNIFDRP